MCVVITMILSSLTPTPAAVFERTVSLSTSNDKQDDNITSIVKFVNSFNADPRIKFKCDAVSRLCECTFKLDVNESDTFHVDLQKASFMVAMAETKKQPKNALKMKYSDPMLGELKSDEPLLHIGLLPQSDDTIGTKFILEQTLPCIEFKGEPCTRKYPIDSNTISNVSESLAKCDILTSPIHGYKASPDEYLNEALALYHSKYYNSSCNLVVDWTKGAADKTGLHYDSVGESERKVHYR